VKDYFGFHPNGKIAYFASDHSFKIKILDQELSTDNFYFYDNGKFRGCLACSVRVEVQDVKFNFGHRTTRSLDQFAEFYPTGRPKEGQILEYGGVKLKVGSNEMRFVHIDQRNGYIDGACSLILSSGGTNENRYRSDIWFYPGNTIAAGCLEAGSKLNVGEVNASVTVGDKISFYPDGSVKEVFLFFSGQMLTFKDGIKRNIPNGSRVTFDEKGFALEFFPPPHG
jgi:hypothetical protein